MGNFIGKAPTSPYDKSLINQLHQRSLNDLAECVNMLAEDYPECQCIDIDQFSDIFGVMVDDPEPFFLKLQNSHDIKGTVDVYETLAAFAVFSKEKFEKKVTFMFKLFDFDHSNTLELNELVLTLQSAARGLCKFVHIPPPTLSVLEDAAFTIFSLIDHDNNKKITYDEFLFWIQHNAELQDFLLKYANTQTFENMKKRFDTIYSLFKHLFIMACGAPMAEYAEEDALKKLLSTEGKAYVKESDLKFLFEVLRQSTVTLSEGKISESDKKISRKVYDNVMKAWSAFSSADIDNSNSLSSHEMAGLLWVYEGQEPTEVRVSNEIQTMDKDRSGEINREEWISNLCSEEKNGKAVFRSNLRTLFEKYDMDNSGSLNLEEIKALVRESFKEYLKRTTDKALKAHLDHMIDTLADEVLAGLDREGSTNVSWDEFKNYMEVSMNKINKLKGFLDNTL